jgi:hypothetical protein
MLISAQDVLIDKNGALSRQALRAIEAVQYITNHLRIEDDEKKVGGEYRLTHACVCATKAPIVATNRSAPRPVR